MHTQETDEVVWEGFGTFFEMHLAQSLVIAKGANHVKSEKCSKAGSCTVYGWWCIACPCGNGSPRNPRTDRNRAGCNRSSRNCTGDYDCCSNYTGRYDNNCYGYYHNDCCNYTGRHNNGNSGSSNSGSGGSGSGGSGSTCRG